METTRLRKATESDRARVLEISYNLDTKDYSRDEKISKAILSGGCFLIIAEGRTVGFILFDYRFFDRGWVELIVVDEKCRGQGIGSKALQLICLQSSTDKVFTSTNQSNIPMQKALSKAGFVFAGEIIGLDEGDPELFYFRTKSDL